MHALAAFGADAPVLDAEDGDAPALRTWLRTRIAAMLDGGERARLMAILYRVDVRERDVTAALATDDPAGALADALVQRALDAHATRQRYRRAAGDAGSTPRPTNDEQSSGVA